DEWFALWPTLSVAKLARAAGHLPELAASPWLAHLRGLDLSDNDVDSAALAYLASSRYVCLLEGLDLSGNPLGVGGAAVLGNAWSSDELREVHLARGGLRGEGLRALLGPRSDGWRRLDLSHNCLYPRELVPLAESPLLRNLTALDLASNPVGGLSI